MGYTESLTMTAVPAVDGSGVPTGTEAISGVVSLSRSILNDAGQTVETDDYYDLSGITYSTSTYLGTAGTNYYATYYGYDANGYLSRTQDASATIYRTIYDGRGRVVSKWVGTNDTPTSGSWSPSNPAGMVEVEADVYDGSGVGDGNLTQQTLYTGGGTQRSRRGDAVFLRPGATASSPRRMASSRANRRASIGRSFSTPTTT